MNRAAIDTSGDPRHHGEVSRSVRRMGWQGAWMVFGAACGEPASPNATGATAPREASDREATPAPAVAPPPALPRPSDPAAFVGPHVLLPHGATLHLGPEPGAATVTLRLPAAAGERAPTPAVAMRVASHAGGRLELRPASPELGCVPVLPALASFDVAVWVEPAALARVLGRRVEARFADGTSVTLRPGVLVGPPGERVEVSADGLRLAVPIAEGDVSTLYAAEPAPAVPTGLRALEPGAPLVYAGGDPVLPEAALVGGGLVLARREHGDRTIVRVGSRCAEVEALVDPARLQREPAAVAAVDPAAGGEELALGKPSTAPASGRYTIRGPSDDPKLARGGDTWSVEPGKPLTWPSGVAAGTTRAPGSFGVAPVTRGDRLCFAIAPSEAAVAEGETLPLCLLATDVTHHEDPLRLAASAGILGMLAADSARFEPSPFASAFADDDDLAAALALGDLAGDAAAGGDLGSGMGGLALIGEGGGGGGGGTGEGTLGLGTLGGGGGDVGTARGAGPTSKIETGKLTVTGLEQAAVARQVVGSRAQLRDCHEKQLGSDPGLAGPLRLSLAVKGGKITRAVATGGSLPAALLRCVERSAKRWSLAGDGTAEIPLVLSLEE